VSKGTYFLVNLPTTTRIEKLTENTEYKFRVNVFERLEKLSGRQYPGINNQNYPNHGFSVGMSTNPCTPPSKDNISLSHQYIMVAVYIFQSLESIKLI